MDGFISEQKKGEQKKGEQKIFMRIEISDPTHTQTYIYMYIYKSLSNESRVWK